MMRIYLTTEDSEFNTENAKKLLRDLCATFVYAVVKKIGPENNSPHRHIEHIEKSM
jgi:hypothetical protein